jgi:hypothetical protein
MNRAFALLASLLLASQVAAQPVEATALHTASTPSRLQASQSAPDHRTHISSPQSSDEQVDLILKFERGAEQGVAARPGVKGRKIWGDGLASSPEDQDQKSLADVESDDGADPAVAGRPGPKGRHIVLP